MTLVIERYLLCEEMREHSASITTVCQAHVVLVVGYPNPSKDIQQASFIPEHEARHRHVVELKMAFLRFPLKPKTHITFRNVAKFRLLSSMKALALCFALFLT